MGKLLKVVFGLLAALVLLVVIAAVVLPMVVDPNDFRDEIVAKVKEQTGRDLVIQDDIGLSVFPWLGVELGGLSLGQAQGFGDQPFAAVKRVQVRAKILPLLSKELEVDTVVVDGLRLNLVRTETGATNWDDLAKPGEAEAADEQKPAAGGEGQPLQRLAIGGIQIGDARIDWDDRQAGQRVTIEDFSLQTGDISPGAPLDLSLGFALNASAPVARARFHLAAKLTPKNDNKTLELTPFELRLSEVSRDDGLQADLTLTAAAVFELEKQQYRVDGLRLTLDAKGGPVPGGEQQIVLSGRALRVDLQAQTLVLEALELKAADLAVSVDLQGEKIVDDAKISGTLNLAEFDPRALLQKLGLDAPATTDATVLKRFALSTRLTADRTQAGLEDLRITLDDSTLDGSGRILLTQAAGYRFALNLDRIDLDRYLPPASTAPTQEPQAQAKPAEAAADAPLFTAEQIEQLRGLDVDGSFQAGSVVVKNLTLENARIGVKAAAGDLNVSQEVGKFYHGSLGGDLGLNVTGETPLVKLVQHMKGVQAEPLIKDLTGDDRMAGAGNFNLDVSAKGASVNEIKRALNGNLNLTFTDGAVKGVNLGRMLRETAAKLKGKTLPPDNAANETDFSELKASAVITNGVLKNDDLSAKSPLFRITGQGTVDIGRDTIDYKIKPVLVGTLSGQGGEDLQELQGVPIPVQLSGPLQKPDWQIDLAEALTATQKQKLQKKLDEQLEKKAPGLKNILPGGLKGLFN